MNLPAGQLLRDRVVEHPREALVDALDRDLTGYAALEPQDALLLDGDDLAVLTFREGVPLGAYHAGSGRGGPPALADLAVSGPYSLELHALSPDQLSSVHEESHRVPPGMPADRLAGDPDLAERTRDRAADRGWIEPGDRPRESGSRGPRSTAGSDRPDDRGRDDRHGHGSDRGRPVDSGRDPRSDPGRPREHRPRGEHSPGRDSHPAPDRDSRSDPERGSRHDSGRDPDAGPGRDPDRGGRRRRDRRREDDHRPDDGHRQRGDDRRRDNGRVDDRRADDPPQPDRSHRPVERDDRPPEDPPPADDSGRRRRPDSAERSADPSRPTDPADRDPGRGRSDPSGPAPVPEETTRSDRSDEPSDRGEDADAVAAFLADEQKIEAIREQAREQARERASEWGLDDQLE